MLAKALVEKAILMVVSATASWLARGYAWILVKIDITTKYVKAERQIVRT